MSSVDGLIRKIRSVPLVQPAWRLLRGCLLGARRTQVFSIGQFAGAGPLMIGPGVTENPILTARDVTDIDAEFIADPFLVRSRDDWNLFFEVLPKARRGRVQPGVIAVATSTDGGMSWKYRQVVLQERHHLSYPFVLKVGDDFYMVPESQECNEIRLYRASCFPTRWSYVASLLSGDFTDPTPFQFDGSWWMIAESVIKGSRFAGNRANSTLRLFYSDELTGPWSEHPKSPIVEGDQRIARPAGRVYIGGPASRPIRFAQDCRQDYGAAVYAFEITDLTRTTYDERELGDGPLLAGSGQGWNADGMHHIDVQQVDDEWIAVVDGWHYSSAGARRRGR